jgi:hypothetical protein
MLPGGEPSKSDGVDKQEYTGVSRLHGFFFILHYKRASLRNFVVCRKAVRCEEWSNTIHKLPAPYAALPKTAEQGPGVKCYRRHPTGTAIDTGSKTAGLLPSRKTEPRTSNLRLFLSNRMYSRTVRGVKGKNSIDPIDSKIGRRVNRDTKQVE